MSTNISSRLLTEAPRVLVVDGSRVVRKLISRVLKDQLSGVEVVGCGSGEEAQRVLGEGAFDFITIALRLPDMDGLELAKFVRASAAQAYIPIVAVSGDVEDRLHRRSLGEHVTDYFDKSLGFQDGIFPTQGSNLILPHCRQIPYRLSHQGSPSGELQIR